MNEMKKNIRRVFWLYFFLFFMVAIYLVKFVFMDSQETVVNPYNKRLTVVDASVVRGQILDANGQVLAESVNANPDTAADGVLLKREYPYGREFAHMVGYTQRGRSGIEGMYTLQLQKLDNEILQRTKNVIWGTELHGNSLVLTMDEGLQALAYKKLNKQKGAIVVMEPSTGKILACVSYPDFDPNQISDSWEKLNGDKDNSPLINRATQGLYPPGSVFKVVTAVAAMRNLENPLEETYECEGSAVFGDKKIHCFDGKVHGTVDMRKAFAVSCNTYFANLGMEVGAENLRLTADSLLFNSDYHYPLQYVRSSFALEGDALPNELTETAIGQGRTLVTPLHMAMLASAVGNGGLLMEPYVVDYVKTDSGGQKDKHMPKSLGTLFSQEEASLLSDMMELVVTSGTATRVSIKGTEIAGKTGTAENSAGDDHGWFIAFAPARAPEVAVAIVLENCGSSTKTLPIAKELIQYVLDSKKRE